MRGMVEDPVSHVAGLLLLRTILIIDKNGIPLYSINFEQEIDSALTTGFLTAITNFNAEMINKGRPSKSKFTQTGQEGGIFWIFEGESVTLALLLKSRASNQFKKAVWFFLNKFEKKYEKELKEFSGVVSAFEGTVGLLRDYLRIYYLYQMRIDDKRLREKDIARMPLKKVLDYYLENFQVGHTVSIQELIDHSFKLLKTLTYEEILFELIVLVESGVLIPDQPESSQE